MRLLNPVENLVLHLPALDEDLARAAQAIKDKLSAGPNGGLPPPGTRHAVQEERKTLMTRLLMRYSPAEIEAADVKCNHLNESGLWANIDRVGQGADRFRLAVDHAGAPIRYVPVGDQVSAHVFAHYNLKSGRAAVLMVSGDFGASLTNVADRLIPFIQRQHIGRRGIKWKDVTWIYRDTLKTWDQIVVTDFDGGNTAAIGFSPLGKRTELDALEAMRANGIVLDAHDRAHIRSVL